ncbi:hypothetical protein GGR79_001581 [Xanthomonas arboricola]|uniref:hypothetical protein n=1 Tax=Xanthomonas arboricola TaxID=56448 RepID=UPI00142F6C88|nr:hypothetical protein [Xanthomonas arboricola]NJC30114.1 hypothetical protein [Xanthomonas arboricola]
MQLLKREAVLLALAPALGMLGVYAYESGRYRFLKVPSLLIDLPINRLLMGGVAIAVLVTLLLMAIGVLLKWMVGRSWFARFLTMFVVFYIFLGLPLLLYTTTLKGALSSLIVPVCFALSGVSEMEKKVTTNTEDRKVLPWLPDALFLAFGVLLTSWLISGFGFWNERMAGDRICQNGSLVVGVYRDNLIIKALPKPGAELDDAVTLVSAAGAVLRECSPSFVGGRGVSTADPSPR